VLKTAQRLIHLSTLGRWSQNYWFAPTKVAAPNYNILVGNETLWPALKEALRAFRDLLLTLLKIAVPVIVFLAIPAVLAIHAEAWGIPPLLVGAVFLMILFEVAIIILLEGAGRIYGFRTLWIIPKPEGGYSVRFDEPFSRGPVTAMTCVAISYLIALYSFAILFMALSKLDPAAFSEALQFDSAIYFTAVTAATVGYGDIEPTSRLARLIVLALIVTNFVYLTLFFSAVAGRAWAKPYGKWPPELEHELQRTLTVLNGKDRKTADDVIDSASKE
jgi:hypothetical protein